MAATVPVNEDGTVDRIVVGGVERMFSLTVSPSSLNEINQATSSANAAAKSAESKADAAVRSMSQATDELRASVLDVLAFMSVNDEGQPCVTYYEGGGE